MKQLSRKKVLGISLLMAAIGFVFFVRSSTFAHAVRLSRMASYAASNGHEQFRFAGNVKATPKGKRALELSIRSLMKVNQIYLFIGRLFIRGKITPLTPGTPIPSKLRFAVLHKNATGKVVRTTNFDANVQSNGVILTQNFAFSFFDIINPREVLDLSVIPFDKNLPPSTLTLSVTHAIGGSAAAKALEEESKEEIGAATVVPKFSFVFNNYLSGHRKNEIIGPLLLRIPTALHYYSRGTVHVQGKITPLDPGGLPNRFQIIMKYKLQKGGKLLKTETYNVSVRADGRILPQNFPVDGTTDIATPDLLETSMRYLDHDIPDRVVNVLFSFAPAPAVP